MPYTTQLFGYDVAKAAKEIEDCAKIGSKMLHYGSSNYRGPSSFRGGSGGFRGRFRTRPRGYGRGRGSFALMGNDAKNGPRRGGLRNLNRH
ncbi:hypothetical protein DPMN_150771 [Dreissena polymorpha]|uniref:Uncharacterized protein n=1 Tax=Dreissena polymorpha TaxID=45954 RepID=A0A9D4IU77_DREPO|nr:hypothetical protein DPMN_163204 [Dreissena polymorpha]KAH3797195.1 hypothetical protein DPMN_150771 [Dreissena polymorpha]